MGRIRPTGRNDPPGFAMTSSRPPAGLLSIVGLLLMVVAGPTGKSVQGLALAPVYWNSSNSLFKASTSSVPVDVQPSDQIDFICPTYNNITDDQQLLEVYTIYQVTKSEFDDCILHNSSANWMLVNCSAPNVKRRYTLVFERFPSIPFVPEYIEGNVYYFITMSTGTAAGLSNTVNGACKSLNMKLSFNVLSTSTTTTTIALPQPSASMSSPSSTSSTTLSTSKTPAATSTSQSSFKSSSSTVNSSPSSSSTTASATSPASSSSVEPSTSYLQSIANLFSTTSSLTPLPSPGSVDQHRQTNVGNNNRRSTSFLLTTNCAGILLCLLTFYRPLL